MSRRALASGVSSPPRPSSSLFGRGADLADLHEAVTRGNRLLTLTGVAGSGKSRLAIEVAARLSRRTAYVDLSPHESLGVEELRAQVARALGFPPPRSEDSFRRHLTRATDAGGPTVLVIDAADTLAPGEARRALVRWLEGAPDLALIVTARERLGLPEERVTRVAPLDHEDAVALLAERAGVPPSADAEALVRVAQLLDGLPLALELAAPHVATMGARALAALLGEAKVTLPPLDAALESTWSRLGESEREVLAQVSVFRGDVALDAARAVVRFHIAPATSLEANLATLAERSLLATLAERSLLVRANSDDAEALPRWRIYETVRRWCQRKVVASEAALRHARYFGDPDARSPSEEDAPNIVEAYATASRVGDLTLAARCLTALEPIVLARGSTAWWIERARDVVDQLSSGPDRARLLVGLGLVTLGTGRFRDAIAPFTIAAAACEDERLSQWAGVAHAKAATAMVYVGLEGTLSEEHFALAAAAFAKTAHPVLEGAYLLDRASACHRSGRESEAHALRERAVAVLKKAGDARELACALGYLAFSCTGLGRFDEGLALARRAATQSARLRDLRAGHRMLAFLGMAELASGDPTAALATFARSSELARQLDDEAAEGVAMTGSGDALLALGRLEDAEAAYRRAGELLVTSGAASTAAVALGGLGVTKAMRGEIEEARELLSRVDELAEGNPPALVVLEIHRGHLALAEGDPAAARLALQAAERRNLEGLAFSSVRLDVRLAARRLSAAIRRMSGSHDKPPTGDLAATVDLRIAHDGAWFERGGERVVIARAGAMRRLLVELVDRHIAGTANGITREALFEIGWPGEQIRVDSARNRVNVTLSRLRRSGLGSLLVSEGDHVRLAPDARVVRDAN